MFFLLPFMTAPFYPVPPPFFFFFLIHCQFTDTVSVFSSEFHGSSCLASASQNTYLTANSPPDLSLKKSLSLCFAFCRTLWTASALRQTQTAVLRAREVVLLPTSLVGPRSVCTALPAPHTFLLPFNYRASPCRKPSWKSQLVPAMTPRVISLNATVGTFPTRAARRRSACSLWV